MSGAKRTGINTAFNIATRLWSLVSIFLFVPLYIILLGESAYGLVSVFSTLQATLNILGLGLANTLGREFATGEFCEENNSRKIKLLKSTEILYVAIGFIIFIICFAFSDFIANDWLNIENLDPKLVSTVITLMGVSIALQLVGHLYSGCLLGLEHQVLANSYCISWSALKSIGSLLIIWLISPNLILFYAWHIVTDILYIIALRISIRKKCPCKAKWRFSDFGNLKSIWQYTLGILIISITSLFNRQLDKLIISNQLSLTDVGAYNVATTLGSLTSVFPSAVYTAIFPKFTAYASLGQTHVLKESFVKFNKLVNIVLMCMGCFIAVYAVPLIHVWTGSIVYKEILGITGTLVVLAVMFSEIQEIPYALALAHGNTRINVLIGVSFLPIVLFSTLIGVGRWGLIGAGAVYLIMMFLQSVLFLLLVCRKYMKDSALKIVIMDMALPFLTSFLSALLSYLLVVKITQNSWLQVALAIGFGAITLMLSLIIFMKKDVKYFLRRKINNG